jgi:DmsE family decaheme c-type cytochrome
MGHKPWLWLASPLTLALLGAPPSVGAQEPGGYAGSQVCMTCHPQSAAQFSQTVMGKLFMEHPRNETQKRGCEGCHGPGASHVASGGQDRSGLITFGKKSKNPVAERNAVCLQCHEKAARMFWQGSTHESREVACTNCHNVMDNVSERGNLKRSTVLATCAQCHLQRASQSLRFSHMPLREGKLECTSCHNPHGTPNDKLLIAGTVNEVCYACHTEKRGPFLHQHPPVSENCANCHDPHGSNHEKMLKTAKPRLCQQCHDPTRHPSRAYAINDPKAIPVRFIPGRQCVNCHFNIHGSNHPSGKAFTR